MTLQRFLVAALLVFVLGIGALYAGSNRVPFRQGESHGQEMQHKSSRSSADITACSGNAGSTIVIQQG